MSTTSLKTALVTGSSGFIGRGLAQQLLQDNVSVVGFDRRESTLRHPRYRHECLELSEIRKVPKVDVIFHVAGHAGTGGWGSAFSDYVRDNIEATAALLEAAKDFGGRIVLVSSGSVYGSSAEKILDESVQPRPFSPYAVTKRAAEDIALAYRDNFGIDLAIARLFYVVGPGQREDVFVYKILEGAFLGRPVEVFGSAASAVRDFVGLEDVCRGLISIGVADELAYDLYNICSERLVSLEDVLKFAGELSGASAVWDAGDNKPGYLLGAVGSSQRMLEEFGWSATQSVWEALRAEYDWLVQGRGGNRADL